MSTQTRILNKKYEFIKELGRGGMGIIYLAKDHNLDRFVAIKELVPNQLNTETENKELIERFKREGLSAASLSHSNIINIFDIISTDESNFIVMEYLEGISLKNFNLTNNSFKIIDIIDFMIQVALGLEHAHSKGIIHRDIKPDNIQITPENNIKIMDFGIAGIKNKSKRLTEAGSLLGTIGYISPEQLYNPKNIDLRTDIFSYGAMFYEVLTKKLPFEGKNVKEYILNTMEKEAEPIKKTIPYIIKELDDLILKCLEKSVSKRYQKFKDILNDLNIIKLLIINSKLNEMVLNLDEIKNNSKISNTNMYELVNITNKDFISNTLINKLKNELSGFYNEIELDDFYNQNINFVFEKSFGSLGTLDGQFISPKNIYLSRNELLWITDGKNNRVQIFDTDGAFIGKISYENMKSPCSITQDNDYNTYILDSEDCKIRVFDKNNNFIFEFGGKGEKEENLNSASSILFLSENRIYVTAHQENLIKVYDTKGKYLKTISNNITSPIAITTINDKLIILDSATPKVQITSKEGRNINNFGKKGLGKGEFTIPRGIATDKLSNIYITEKLTHRVQVFDQNGKFLYSFGKKGNTNLDFNSPSGIIITNNFKIFIVDSENSRIQVFKLVKNNG